MEKKKQNRLLGSLRKYSMGLIILLIVLVVMGYFVNIIFLKNQETVISVLLLEYTTETAELENRIKEIISVDKDQKVEIKSIDSKQDANRAIALTWIRAKSVDIVIGTDEEMTYYAQTGCLKKMKKGTEPQDFMCGLAEYDSQGSVIDIGPKECYGKYVTRIEGITITNPVISLMSNATNEETAKKVLENLSE